MPGGPWPKKGAPGGGVLHYGARRGCAPVLGFWPENSVIGVYCH